MSSILSEGEPPGSRLLQRVLSRKISRFDFSAARIRASYDRTDIGAINANPPTPFIYTLCAVQIFPITQSRLLQNSSSHSLQDSDTESELRIEKDKPPRHKETKTRIGEILQQSKFVTSCLGDLVVKAFSSPKF